MAARPDHADARQMRGSGSASSRARHDGGAARRRRAGKEARPALVATRVVERHRHGHQRDSSGPSLRQIGRDRVEQHEPRPACAQRLLVKAPQELAGTHSPPGAKRVKRQWQVAHELQAIAVALLVEARADVRPLRAALSACYDSPDRRLRRIQRGSGTCTGTRAGRAIGQPEADPAVFEIRPRLFVTTGREQKSSPDCYARRGSPAPVRWRVDSDVRPRPLRRDPRQRGRDCCAPPSGPDRVRAFDRSRRAASSRRSRCCSVNARL